MLKRLLLIVLLYNAALFAQNETESSDFSYPLKLYNQFFYDLAAQQFIKFYTNYPNSAKADQAYYFAGMSFFKLEKYDKARAAFQSLAVGYPKSAKAADAWLQTGLCSEKLHEKEEAVKSYQTIRLLYPKSPLAPEGLYKAGGLLLDDKHYNEAFQAFRVIADQYTASSFYAPSLVKSALSLLYQDEADKAEQLVKRVFKMQVSDETRAEADLAAARIKIYQGYSQPAKEYLNHLIKSYSKSSFRQDALLLLSRIYISEKNYKEAGTLLASGLNGKNDQQIHEMLGNIYFMQRAFSKAQSEFEASGVSEKSPSYQAQAVQLKIALCLRRQNKPAAARKVLLEGLSKALDKTSAFYTAIDSIYLTWLEKDKQFAEAISVLNGRRGKTASVFNEARNSVHLAKLLIKSGRWRDVIPVLQPLTLMRENFPEKDDMFFYLAQAYEQTENYQESIYYYNKVVSGFGASIHYDTSVEHLEFLKEYKIINKNGVVESLADVTAAMVNGTDTKKLQFKLGRIYLKELKKPEKAEQQFLTALDDSSSFAGDIHLYLGNAYISQSRLAKASAAKILTDKAIHQFQLALQNKASCSAPDEASWRLVEQKINKDTLSVNGKIKLLKSLTATYPNSSFSEEWLRNLAYRTAFDTSFSKDSFKYFQVLVEKYVESELYPDYLFGFAQSLQESNPDKALGLYKEIASEHPYAHSAAEALYRVSADYEEKHLYKEAAQLNAKISSQYYYAPQALQAAERMGPLLVRAGDFKQAVAALKQILHTPFLEDDVLSQAFLSASVFDKIFYLARAYEGIEKSQQALKYYKKYLKLALNGEHQNEARFGLGEIYFALQKKQAAADNFKEINKNNPSLFNQAQLYLGEIYFQQSNFIKSAAVYKTLQEVENEPQKKEEIAAKYVVSLIRAGKIKAGKTAIASYKKQFPKKKNNPARFIVELADYYRLNKNYKKAEKLLREVKKKYKSSDYTDDADYTLALIDVTLNKTEAAFKILSKFYSTYPSSNKMAAALNTLGTLYFRTEKYDNAISLFKNALKAHPEVDLEANISSNLIKTYTLTGFWDAAQALSRQYVDKFPQRPDVMDKKIIIAQSYINLNQFQNAVDYLKKIKIEADSEREPEIQFYIGEALLKGGQYENAIAEFVKIPLLSRKTKLQWEASALYYSGQSYEKLGRINDAVRMYKEIIRRPGIDLILKREAKKRIKQIQ